MDEATNSADTPGANASAAGSATKLPTAAAAGPEGRASRHPPTKMTATYSAEFDLTRNALYHQARENWFSTWHRILMFSSAISGVGAGTALVGTIGGPEVSKQVATLLSFAVGVLTAVDLVVDLSGSARLHAKLKQDYYNILSDMAKSETPNLYTIRANMVKIYGLEPPSKRAVDAIAWNQAYLSLNPNAQKSDLCSIGPLRRLLRHIRSYEAVDFSPR